MPWVVFDIGGVMVRIRSTWGEAADAAGVSIFEDARPKRQPDFEWVDPYQAGEIETAAFLESLRTFLGGVQQEEAIAVHNAFLAEAFPGIEDLVDELNDAKMDTACLSNTNELHWQVLRGSGTYPAIDRLGLPAASQNLKLFKPQPEIYRAFEELAGAKPSELYYFDDHPDYVASATALGWNAQRIDPHGDPAEQIRTALQSHGIIKC